MAEEQPVRIGRYAVSRRLGSGGMGEVFLAYSPAGSPVAVKLIRSDRLDPHTRARFEREARIARTVVGTNRVARFLDADPYAERPWLAMEYVPGRTLLQHVTDTGVLPAPLVASLGALLAEGLAAVHEAKLLHRDLKPQNIMLGAEGPMIIDFGLAAFLESSQESLTSSGTIIGTVRCMPPEQALGATQVTTAADVYSLGTVLLFAAAGHYPYDGPRWEAIAAQVANPEVLPDLEGVPAPLRPLLDSMLAHQAEHRPTVEEVAEGCAGLLRAAGADPATARLALIGQTRLDGAAKPSEFPSASVERLLRGWAALGADPEASPLDGAAPGAGDAGPGREEEPGTGPSGAGAGLGKAAEPVAGQEEQDPVPSGGRSRGGQSPGSRVSRRVARELRERYAVQSSL
jgi:serine/threonine protein kinase